MAVEKSCFRMTSSACGQPKTRGSPPSVVGAVSSPGHVFRAAYLVRFQHPAHHIATCKHVHPDVDIGLAALDPAVVPHPLQALLCPVVVGEETIACVEKHPVAKRLRLSVWPAFTEHSNCCNHLSDFQSVYLLDWLSSFCHNSCPSSITLSYHSTRLPGTRSCI